MPTKIVLLIESDPDHREILTSTLEHHGYLVFALEPDDLLGMVEDLLRPDLIVVALPAEFGGGRSVFDWIGSSDELRGIPILCLSDESGPWKRDEALERGCSVFCVKPVSAASFAVQVRDLVGPSIDGGGARPRQGSRP